MKLKPSRPETCERKVHHPTRRAAKAEAKVMRKRHGGHFSAYECQVCGGWHVGHTPTDKLQGRGLER